MAEAVPTRVLRPHAAGHAFGDPGGSGNLLIHGDNLRPKALLPFYRISRYPALAQEFVPKTW